MSEQNKNPQNTHEEFAAIIGASYEGRPSIESQHELVAELINGRFKQEWDEAGLTRDIIIPQLPEDYVGENLIWSLDWSKSAESDHVEISILAIRNAHPSAQVKVSGALKIPVAVMVEGEAPLPASSDVDFKQAELLAAQAAVLDELREQGYVPDLSRNLRISNPATSIMRLPQS